MMLMIGLVGAMRASELSGLERGDVDLERGRVSINRSHTEGHIGKPKTEGAAAWCCSRSRSPKSCAGT